MSPLLFAHWTWPDGLALLWMLVLWFVYGRFADHLPPDDVKPSNLNQMMHHLRRAWMRRMLDREERIIDSSLTGHSVSATTFFASTSMLIIAGLLGVLGNAGAAHDVIQSFGFVARSSVVLFEIQILGLVILFIVAFYKFTWALRQFNFACTLIGAAPAAPVEPALRDRFADHAARVMSLAVVSFNGGIRAYYFAMAWLGWFIHPIAFAATTSIVVLVLLKRQVKSRSQQSVAEYYDAAWR
ncbi:DUF599 domain-containing protein [Dongia sp.]|uniref:DUF599 domain-containing protein n=1 Tax=Dongia sp. TaxID=1977262 RepID=UPI0035B0624C